MHHRIKVVASFLVFLCAGLLLCACEHQTDKNEPVQSSAWWSKSSPERPIPLTWMTLQETINEDNLDRLDYSLEQAARRYLSRRLAVFEKNNYDFRLKNQFTTETKTSHLRLQQTYKDLPIFGAEVAVHAEHAAIRSVNGNLLTGLEFLRELELSPNLSPEQALESARRWYIMEIAKRVDLEFDFLRETFDLLIYASETKQAYLAYSVSFFTELQHGIKPGRWKVFVDARTGEVLFAANTIDTLSQASGPGGNPKHPHTWNAELDVEATADPNVFKMDTSRLRTTNLNNSTYGNGTIVQGPLNPIGDAAINDAHGYAELTLWMLSEMGHPNSINDAGFKLISRVHYGYNYENAFWDGTQMTYGDGDYYFYPLSGSLDVVAHEISHGFTEFHSGLNYWNESGGMNESFSDIGGTVAEFLYEGASADWDIGEDIYKQPGGLRNMCDPKSDGNSIDHYDDYYDGLDVHFSSGIMNKAFCHIAKRFASGDVNGNATPESVVRAGRAFFLANAAYWVASSSFEQGCQGVLAASLELGYGQQEKDWIKDSFQDVGVYCFGKPIECDQTFTTASGQFSSPNYPSNYPNNFTKIWCIEPGNQSLVTLTFSDFQTEANYDFVTIYDADQIQLSKTSGNTPPPTATSTKLFMKFVSDGYENARGFQASWEIAQQPDGSPCAYDNACQSGICENEVCCHTTCEGECRRCNLPDFLGTCTALAIGELCGNTSETECSAPDRCDAQGVCQPNHAAEGMPCGDQNLDCHIDDTCDGMGNCADRGLWEAGFPCGDPTNNECTDPDTCDEHGVCQPRHVLLGAPCGNQGIECLLDDACDGNGFCLEKGPAPEGAACGDPTQTACTNPDSCDGNGSCLKNHAALNTPCGNQGVACHMDDLCDGAGTCVGGLVPEGTACGDPTESDCTLADSCSANGLCLPNHRAEGTPCGDPSLDCHHPDTCDGSGACVDQGLMEEGSPCGDATGTECSLPDTCNALGSCLPNHLELGSPCGIQDLDCHHHDSCDGMGNCVDFGFMEPGASCGDPNDQVCSGPDQCDESGICQPNHMPDNTPCLDNGLFCDGIETCQAGVCQSSGNPCENNQVCNEEADTCDPKDEGGGCATSFGSASGSWFVWFFLGVLAFVVRKKGADTSVLRE